MRDPYDILGVARTASADDIRKAYRKRARETHPDRNPDDKTAESRFKEVQGAYEIVGDEEKRKAFDRFGHAAFSQGAGPGPRGAGPEFDLGDMDLGDILGGIFGGGKRGRRTRAAPVGEDWQAEAFVPFEIAALGGELDITVTAPQRQRLSVSVPPGLNDGDKLRLAGKGGPAPTPGGKPGNLIVTARVEPHPYFTRDGADLYLDVPIAMSEALLGATIAVPTLEDRAEIAVPPGASSGQKLRIRGRGVPQRDGRRGDFYARIKIVAPKTIDDRLREAALKLRELEPPNPRAGLGWK